MSAKQPYTEARKRANEKWNAENTRQIKFTLMLKGDADVLNQIEKQPRKTDYLRRLVREDIAREQDQK